MNEVFVGPTWRVFVAHGGTRRFELHGDGRGWIFYIFWDGDDVIVQGPMRDVTHLRLGRCPREHAAAAEWLTSELRDLMYVLNASCPRDVRFTVYDTGEAPSALQLRAPTIDEFVGARTRRRVA